MSNDNLRLSSGIRLKHHLKVFPVHLFISPPIEPRRPAVGIDRLGPSDNKQPTPHAIVANEVGMLLAGSGVIVISAEKPEILRPRLQVFVSGKAKTNIPNDKNSLALVNGAGHSELVPLAMRITAEDDVLLAQ